MNAPARTMFQVLVVSVKNWSKELPENTDDLHEIRDRKSVPKGELIPHSMQFRSRAGSLYGINPFSP